MVDPGDRPRARLHEATRNHAGRPRSGSCLTTPGDPSPSGRVPGRGRPLGAYPDSPSSFQKALRGRRRTGDARAATVRPPHRGSATLPGPPDPPTRQPPPVPSRPRPRPPPGTAPRSPLRLRARGRPNPERPSAEARAAHARPEAARAPPLPPQREAAEAASAGGHRRAQARSSEGAAAAARARHSPGTAAASDSERPTHQTPVRWRPTWRRPRAGAREPAPAERLGPRTIRAARSRCCACVLQARHAPTPPQPQGKYLVRDVSAPAAPCGAGGGGVVVQAVPRWRGRGLAAPEAGLRGDQQVECLGV